jgi:glutamine synthetase
MAGSEIACELLGEAFVEHYLMTRRQEVALWRTWREQTITDWELNRYFETL